MSHNLPLLESLCKRDPAGYREEVLRHIEYFNSLVEIMKIKPQKDNRPFLELLNFIGQVAPSYASDLVDLPAQLSALLEGNLEPKVRMAIVKALIRFRNKGLLSPAALLPLFFKLFRCHDKALRVVLYNHIIGDIKTINKKKKNNSLNKQLVNFMFTMLQDPTDIAVLKSLEVMISLYRMKIWNDAKTVNVIATALFHPSSKIVMTALHFFLGVNEEEEEKAKRTQADIQADLKQAQAKIKIGKKTRKKEKKLKALAKEASETVALKMNPNWPAIELIHDPNGHCKKVFGMLKHTNHPFEVRLAILNYLSRLISCHQLIFLNIFPYLIKYLEPHQKYVTHFLALTAQCCHSLVPPEEIQPVMRVIADRFVNDKSRPESIAIGINVVREIISRQPLAMTEELVRDLVAYKKSHDKAVVAAARSVLQLVRRTRPELLRKRDRANAAAVDAPLPYGAQIVSNDVDGIELLKADKKKKLLKEQQKALGKDVDVDKDSDEEDENDFGDGWVIDNSDSEDDEMEEEEEEEDGESNDNEEDEDNDEELEEPEKEEKNKNKESQENVELDEDEDEDGIDEEDNEDENEEDEDEDEEEDDDAAAAEEEEEEEDEEEESISKQSKKGKTEKGLEKSKKDDDLSKMTRQQRLAFLLGNNDEEKIEEDKTPEEAKPEKPVPETKAPEVEDHILTQEDFARIKELKRKQQAGELSSDYEDMDDSDDENGPFNFVNPDDIEVEYKHKLTAEDKERIAKEKKEARKNMFEHKRGQTNKAKARNKNFIMRTVGKRHELLSKTTKTKKKGKRQQIGKFNKKFGRTGGKSVGKNGFRR